MKKFLLIILLTMLATPAWATNYFLAPASAGGNDSNNGTSASTPWLSPNHAVNCGDVIIAAASTSYSSANFVDGKWGTVTCAGGNNVAWLKCATFDACKIASSSNHAMKITNSYWGVEGWEASTTGSSNACFAVQPLNSSTSLHHIIFANDVANTCSGGGFNIFYNGSAGADYLAVVGNIAYDTATGGGECFSGFSVNTPVKHDSLAGTHIYFAGNFAYANMDPNPCAGTAPTDGEGLIFDTINGQAYNQQLVAYNNIFVGNGGRCIQPFNSRDGAPIFIEYNTCWGNETDTHQNSGGSCAEVRILNSYNTTALHNIAQATATTGCGGYTLYAYFMEGGNGTDSVASNWGYAASGNTSGIDSSPGFSYGANTFGSPSSVFTNPSLPGAPNCGSASGVPNCMAALISNFTPTNTSVASEGYQAPLSTNVNDPLFPQWLCNVNLPSGLVTMGCASSASSPAPPTNINITVQ